MHKTNSFITLNEIKTYALTLYLNTCATRDSYETLNRYLKQNKLAINTG